MWREGSEIWSRVLSGHGRTAPAQVILQEMLVRLIAKRCLSEEAILDSLGILLLKHADSLHGSGLGTASVPSPCLPDQEIRHGPMDCRKGWFRRSLGSKLPYVATSRPWREILFAIRPIPSPTVRRRSTLFFAPYPRL